MKFVFTIAMFFSVLSAPAFAFEESCDQRSESGLQDLRSFMHNVNIIGKKDNRCRISRTNLGKCSAKKDDLRNRNVVINCPNFVDQSKAWGTGVLVSDNVVCTNVHLFLKDGAPKGSLDNCSVTTQGKKRQSTTINFGPNGGRDFKFPTELPEFEDQAGKDLVCIQLSEKVAGIKPIPIDYSGRLMKGTEELLWFAAFQNKMETSQDCKVDDLSEPIAQVCPKMEVASMGLVEQVAYSGCSQSPGASGGPVYVCVGDQPVLVALNRLSGAETANGLPYDRKNPNKHLRSYSQAVMFNEEIRKNLEQIIGNVQMAKVPEGKPQRRQGANREVDI